MGGRVRRSADEARQIILSAAEKRLRAGGPAAVRVQLVARDVGLTDAAVHHHFGSRKGLLTALLRQAARDLRGEIEAALRSWESGSRDLSSLTDRISDCYGRRGYARLAMWLILSGTRGKGSGMLAALVDALHQGRVIEARERGVTAPSPTETQFVVTLFHMVQVAEPLFGEAMRRSAGLPSDEASHNQFRAWLLNAFEILLRPIGRPISGRRRRRGSGGSPLDDRRRRSPAAPRPRTDDG
jgi:AcrR family transcriptional regulator